MAASTMLVPPRHDCGGQVLDRRGTTAAYTVWA